MLFLKNYDPKLSYMLADLFNKCFKETYFPDCWKVSSVVPMFKNVWKRSVTKNSHPLGLCLVLVVSLNEDFDLNSLNWFAFFIAVGFLLVILIYYMIVQCILQSSLFLSSYLDSGVFCLQIVFLCLVIKMLLGLDLVDTVYLWVSLISLHV